MNAPRPRTIWLRRLALVTWLGLGLLTAMAAPAPEPMSPEVAEQLYGEIHSIESAAPSGLYAFAAVLERLGFTVHRYYAARPPAGDVLVLLEPSVRFERAEVEALLAWLDGGGRLIYAGGADDMDDRLLAALAGGPARARGETLGSATLLRRGDGRVALLADAGAALTNRALADSGLTAELEWLHEILDGADTVAFDEGRIGLGSETGVVAALARSAFAPALGLAALALLLLGLARGMRTQPALAEPPAGTRAFAESLDGLAMLLRADRRTALARDACVAGTRRRLGPLARAADVAGRLAAIEESLAGQPSPATLTRGSEALRRLENDALR